MAARLKLGLLVCDTPVDSVRSTYGDYGVIFKTLLDKSIARSERDTTFTLDPFDVVAGHYPEENVISTYDGFLISGSSASAYAELPWIPPLLEFISNLATKHPRVNIAGICFGQQVISRALGGRCIPNDKGWEVGVYDVALTDVGKSIFGTETLRIQQMHRDHVPDVPPGFQLLGDSPKTPVQGIVLPYSAAEGKIKSIADVHIIAVQGHPEFLPDIVNKIIDVRGQSGVLDAKTVIEARERAVKEHDGVDLIARVILDMFEAKSP